MADAHPYFHQEQALRIVIRHIIRDLGGVPLDPLAPRTARLTEPIRLVPVAMPSSLQQSIVTRPLQSSISESLVPVPDLG
jgi:hypothetical protein